MLDLDKDHDDLDSLSSEELEERIKQSEHVIKMAQLSLWFLYKIKEIQQASEKSMTDDEYSHLKSHGLRLFAVVEENEALRIGHPNQWESVEGLIAAATGIVGLDDHNRPIVESNKRQPATQAKLADNIVFHAIVEETMEAEIKFTSAGTLQFPSNSMDRGSRS